jgi:hypothetical protein
MLMVVVGMTAENQLLPLAFALVEGENNEQTDLHDFGSSPWFA